MRYPDTVWMPTTPPRQCPPLLTPEEVCVMLRLTNTDAETTVRRLNREDGLAVAYIRGKVAVPLRSLLSFIESSTVRTRREKDVDLDAFQMGDEI